MKLEEHCEECLMKLGDKYEKVHIWLDFFHQYLGPKHRIVRHHAECIEEVRKKWGDGAAAAAKLHIRADFDFVPLDSDAVYKIVKAAGWLE
tara:strand:- start:84 stop:356 length:273 start_codon:yes stop_codon:yes gene_type:complete